MIKTVDNVFKYNDFYDMLSDKARMEAYQEAINKVVKPGDIVVDLGAGTGILGLMALKAGASKVFMIEKSDSIDLAKAVVEQNHFSDKVSFFNESSLIVEIPEKADVIISETLGNFGLDENTLDFIIDARKRFLKPEGKLIPENINIKLTAVESEACFNKLEFWKNINGIDFTPAYDMYSGKIMVEKIEPNEILSEAVDFAQIDFYSVEENSVFNKTYHAIDRTGTIFGFAGWFEIQLCEGVNLSTSPLEEPTHWQQAFFPITQPINVVKLDLLEISMLIGPTDENTDNTHITYEYRCTQRGKD